MPSLHLLNISRPLPDGVSPAVKTPAGRLPFSRGETVEAFIAEKVGAAKYLITVRNSSFLADTDMPLKVGQSLLLTVDRLKPQVMLRIVGREPASSTVLNDALKAFRSNPDALIEMFSRWKEIGTKQSLIDLLPGVVKERIRTVLKIMDALLLSPSSLKNPLVIRDFIVNLGLLQEYGLKRRLQDRRDAGKGRQTDNLKGALSLLSAELHEMVKKNDTTGTTDAKILNQLADLADSSVKAIEIQQVLNGGRQDYEGRYVLQLPFLFPEGIKKGEIFVEMENPGKQRDTGNKCRVVILLSMDELGDIMIDASLAGKKIGCCFTFEDREAQAFFFPFLDEVRESLSLLGYEWDYISCRAEKNLRADREAFARGLFAGEDGVNVFI